MRCNSVGVCICALIGCCWWKTFASLFPQDVVARCDQAAQWGLRHRRRRQWFVFQSLLRQDVCVWGWGNGGQVVLRWTRIIRCGLRISVRKRIRHLNMKHRWSRSDCCSLTNLMLSGVSQRNRWTHKHLLRDPKPRQCPQIISALKKRKVVNHFILLCQCSCSHHYNISFILFPINVSPTNSRGFYNTEWMQIKQYQKHLK